MIQGDFTHCKTLCQFYQEIVEFQEEHHGDGYCDVHLEIAEALDESAGGVWPKRYIELGVNQGATLAIANIGTLKSSVAYDINLIHFVPYEHLFRAHVDHPFEVHQKSSVDPSIVKDTEVLYIDTIHRWGHVEQELKLWSPHVTETIIIHDTHSRKNVQRGLKKWVNQNKEWEIVKQNTRNVGYTTLHRKNNES